MRSLVDSLRSTARSTLDRLFSLGRGESLRRRLRPETALAGLLAIVAGLSIFVLATTVFEYHSTNHDEGVYLQQAAMLLAGQLELHAGELTEAFRPWFFVADGGSLYPKYTPVPAAMYALSMALFGEPRVTLAVVAAGNAALVYLLGSMVADRTVGAVAAALFALSPLAFITTATFLPYAPTTFLNLVFAVGYLRGVRERSVRWAGVAGLAIGVAFFARPFTALLFALPFVAHAGYTVVTTARDGLRPLPDAIRRNAVTAVFGLAFVGVTLAYNAVLTGSPLRFPYEAFAPLDGPGFGYRQILGHSLDYTPEVALRANGYALWYLATRWVAAGPLGTALAAVGLGMAVRRWRGGASDAVNVRVDRTAGPLLAGLFVTVPLGNLAFWGNYNVLGTMTDPTDGLVSQFGPFYHFDLLAPVSVFAAVALVALWRWVQDGRVPLGRHLSARSTARVAIAGLLVSLLVVGAVSAVLVSTPLERNAAQAEKYETAYEPIESTTFETGLVFVPTPYGDWQNHPFQSLRNDPGFDGPVVYALDRDPAGDFAVLDAHPNRNYYRYTYRGEWTPNPTRHVVPKLEPLAVRAGDTLDGETVVGVPENVERARVRLETGGGDHLSTTVADPTDELAVGWSLAAGTATLDATGRSVAVDPTDEVVLTVTLVQPDGSTLTYRQEAAVRTTGDRIEVLWPPERTVCLLTTDCGTEGTYLPDSTDVHRDGVFFETRLDAPATDTP